MPVGRSRRRRREGWLVEGDGDRAVAVVVEAEFSVGDGARRDTRMAVVSWIEVTDVIGSARLVSKGLCL